MKTFRFESALRIERPLDEVFGFFSNPENLERITPPWLRFEIVTPTPIDVEVGTRIEYRLRLRGFPLSWTSEITVWEPPRRFVDEQIKGPYRLWRHEHTFEPDGNGATVIGDRVEYAVLGGALINWLLVRRDVRKIFAYRTEKLHEIFDGGDGDGDG